MEGISKTRTSLSRLPFAVFFALLSGTFVIGGSADAQELYIYPSKGQSQAQQDKDRYECHTWAVQQTGFDPSKPQTMPSNTRRPISINPRNLTLSKAPRAELLWERSAAR